MQTGRNIKEYAGLAEGQKDWTNAFKAAVADCAAEGGGTIYVPAGVYNTHSIRLKTNITLNLEAGAVLNFTDDIENYEIIDIEFEGIPMKMYMPCIFAEGEKNVSVVGQGTLDGNGMRWWKELREGTLAAARPYLVCFSKCERVKLDGITLTNSPAWTVHPLYCNDVVVNNVAIKNPADSPNTDGIDPNGSQNVRISNCIIDVGDDCIAIKSGTEDTPNPMPSENITITNCNMLHGHGGVVIGSEMSGSVRNVTVSNCVFQDTDRGIRLKTRRRRGGAMENMIFQNIVMDHVLCPFIFNMYYYCGKNGKEKYVWDKAAYPVDASTPAVRDILVSNVTVINADAAAGFIYGLAEQPVENIVFSNCRIKMTENGPAGEPAMLSNMPPMQQAGFFIRNAKGIEFHQTKIENVKGEVFDIDETAEVMK